MRALTLGAADTCPSRVQRQLRRAFCDILAETLRRVASAPRLPGHSGEKALPPPITLRKPASGRSATSPSAPRPALPALSDFFHALPLEVAVPILLTQHLPAAFVLAYFAAQIQSIRRPSRAGGRGGRRCRTPPPYWSRPGDAHLRACAERRRRGGPCRVRSCAGARPGACRRSIRCSISVATLFGAGGIGVCWRRHGP